MQNQQIILIHGKNYKQMTKQLLQAAGLADEIGSRDTPVALKPNLVIGAPASRGATTHPELVAGVLEYLQENGFRDLRVIEGSGPRRPFRQAACWTSAGSTGSRSSTCRRMPRPAMTRRACRSKSATRPCAPDF